jgi:hypothetical protein
MKAASLSELRNELKTRPPKVVVEYCVRIAKYKKENKELLTYLLYEADDENAYIKNIKEEIDGQFEKMNKTTLYFAKKTIRKALRTTNKYIRYSGSRQTEAELLIHYCTRLKHCGISVKSSKVLRNLYDRQIVRTHKAISTLHEDLQFDYGNEMKALL